VELNTTICPSCGKDILAAEERPVFCPFCGLSLVGKAPAEAPLPHSGESALRAQYAEMTRLFDEYDRDKKDAIGRIGLGDTFRALFTSYRGEWDEIGAAFYQSLQSLSKAMADEFKALSRREEERTVCAELCRDAVRYILLDAENGKKKKRDLFLVVAESVASVLIPFLSDRDLADIRSEYRRSVSKVMELPVQTRILRALGMEQEKRACQ
jgi:uncharacterized Zn finger protein (UPF0148 family)